MTPLDRFFLAWVFAFGMVIPSVVIVSYLFDIRAGLEAIHAECHK